MVAKCKLKIKIKLTGNLDTSPYLGDIQDKSKLAKTESLKGWFYKQTKDYNTWLKEKAEISTITEVRLSAKYWRDTIAGVETNNCQASIKLDELEKQSIYEWLTEKVKEIEQDFFIKFLGNSTWIDENTSLEDFDEKED